MSISSSIFSHGHKPRNIFKEPLNTDKSKDRQILEDNSDMFMKLSKVREHEGRSGGLCMGIHAPWSKGKTLTLVFIGKNRNELEGLPILANFGIRGVRPFAFMDDVEIIKDVSDCIVLTDEIRRYMDSYMSRGQKARFISNLTADLGKQSCDWYYTDQHFNAAPPRVKTNLSVIGEPDFDDETKWITLYLYNSIEAFLMKDPFFYFGYYGPDYWKYYDTTYKVEDFKLKFKVDKYSEIFLQWLDRQPWVCERTVINGQLLNLFNQAEGMELTRAELTAIQTYLKKMGDKLTEDSSLAKKQSEKIGREHD